MSDIGRGSACSRLLRLTGITVGALTLIAAHPGSHDAPQSPASAVPGGQTAAAAPVGVVTAFHIALASGDTAAALALMTEDAVIFESGGVESSRAEYAAHHLQADAAFSAAVSRKLISRVSGEEGDIGWVMSIETVAGTFRSRPINSQSTETMLLRRVEGHWRIAHIHWSSANAA